MKEVGRMIGSLIVFIAFAITAPLAIGLFINGEWVLERIGFTGLILLIVVLNVCAVLSLAFDLTGNVKKLSEFFP